MRLDVMEVQKKGVQLVLAAGILVRWIWVVLVVALINGVRCQTCNQVGSAGDVNVCCADSCGGCTDESGTCAQEGRQECCPEVIAVSGIYCDETTLVQCIIGDEAAEATTTPAPVAPSPVPAPVPDTPSSESMDESAGVDDDGKNSSNDDDEDATSASTDSSSQDALAEVCNGDSLEGTTDAGDVACCKSSCLDCDASQCGGENDQDCCPAAIESSCQDENDPPCVFIGGDAMSALADDGSGSDSGLVGGVIALAVMLAVLLLANAVCCYTFKRRKQAPPPPPPARARDPNVDAELGRLQEHLATEQNRRQTAEAIIQRAKGGGIRPGDFPSVRDVDRDVENLARHAQTWAETACAIGGSRPALPAVVKSVLRNTFLVCREEVQACLDRKLESLSEFLGKNEPIALSGLSGGDSMNLDTQYVLYECLCRNFRDIVPTDPGRMEDLAGMVHQRSGGAADGDLAGDVIYGDAWPAFDNLMKKYIMAFVEMTLQKPAMDFNDDLGSTAAFDPYVHRDFAPHLRAGEQLCCVVFPAIRQQAGRPSSNAKTGVVRLPA